MIHSLSKLLDWLEQGGSHQFRFNKNTLNKVDRVVLVYVNVDDLEVQIIYDAPLSEAENLMIDTKGGKEKAISQSKVLKKSPSDKIRSVVMNEVQYKNYTRKWEN